MEHRLNSRTAVDAAVMVQWKGPEPMMAVARNVHAQGIFLMTGDTVLPQSSVVWIQAATIPNSNAPQRVRALVVHSTVGAASLMFIDEAGCERAFVERLLESQSQAVESGHIQCQGANENQGHSAPPR